MFEILVVLAILSIVATVGIPAVFNAIQKSPLRQAMSDLQEACRNARMMAILRGLTTELVIRAADGTLAVRPVSEARPEGEEGGLVEAESGSPDDPPAEPRPPEIAAFSAKIPPSVAFKKLIVNLQDMGDAEEARVRFYANGTCDALTAHLLSEQNEERSLTLEITTARETVEVVR